MMPSMMACATWMPLGPNSRVRDCTSARVANLLTAKDEKLADALSEAVAPVKISVGGCLGCLDAAWRRRGRMACEKWKPPLLCRFEEGGLG